MSQDSGEVARWQEILLRNLSQYDNCAVAFSGGVDSAVVAKAAHLALGSKAVAFTAVSPSLASGEKENAVAVAQQIGISHHLLSTDELSADGYVRNSGDRCYFCKTELYTQIAQHAPRYHLTNIVSGANQDDLGDYRPGLKAAAENSVRHPLAECGFGKAEVRAMANAWSLPVWDKPASPCLASRIAYGEEVTVERLAMIDRAEQLLRKHGLSPCRVRYHKGDLARVEIPLDALPLFAQITAREEVVKQFKTLGFRFITLDLEGFRSGSLNQLVQISK